MTWAKIDDHFHLHPKVQRASWAQRGLFVTALSYCACFETDGFVPRSWVVSINGWDLALGLVEVGLLERAQDGFTIHDYLTYNPSREEVAERRRADRERQRMSRRDTDQTPGVVGDG